MTERESYYHEGIPKAQKYRTLDKFNLTAIYERVFGLTHSAGCILEDVWIDAVKFMVISGK